MKHMVIACALALVCGAVASARADTEPYRFGGSFATEQSPATAKPKPTPTASDHAAEGGSAYIGALLHKLGAAENEAAQCVGQVAALRATLADREAAAASPAPAPTPTPDTELEKERSAHAACLKRNSDELSRLRALISKGESDLQAAKGDLAGLRAAKDNEIASLREAVELAQKQSADLQTQLEALKAAAKPAH